MCRDNGAACCADCGIVCPSEFHLAEHRASDKHFPKAALLRGAGPAATEQAAAQRAVRQLAAARQADQAAAQGAAADSGGGCNGRAVQQAPVTQRQMRPAAQPGGAPSSEGRSGGGSGAELQPDNGGGATAAWQAPAEFGLPAVAAGGAQAAHGYVMCKICSWQGPADAAAAAHFQVGPCPPCQFSALHPTFECCGTVSAVALQVGVHLVFD